MTQARYEFIQILVLPVLVPYEQVQLVLESCDFFVQCQHHRVDGFPPRAAGTAEFRTRRHRLCQAVAFTQVLDVGRGCVVCLGDVVEQVAEKGFRYRLAQNVVWFCGEAVDLSIQLSQQGEGSRSEFVNVLLQGFNQAATGPPELFPWCPGAEFDEALDQLLQVVVGNLIVC